jgi:hypothetical protein
MTTYFTVSFEDVYILYTTHEIGERNGKVINTYTDSSCERHSPNCGFVPVLAEMVTTSAKRTSILSYTLSIVGGCIHTVC